MAGISRAKAKSVKKCNTTLPIMPVALARNAEPGSRGSLDRRNNCPALHYQVASSPSPTLNTPHAQTHGRRRRYFEVPAGKRLVLALTDDAKIDHFTGAAGTPSAPPAAFGSFPASRTK